MQGWNYANAGAYFITICTKSRIDYFGKIENSEMKLSNIGILANVFLFEIKNHAKNVEIDNYIIMPNHIHCILVLNENGQHKDDGKNVVNDVDICRDVACNVSTEITEITGQSDLNFKNDFPVFLV